MIDPRWIPTRLTEMRGAWSFFDATDVSAPFGLISDNCEFIEGEAKTRFGFGQIYNANEAMTSLDNWVSNIGNFILWFNPSVGLRYAAVSSPTAATIIAEGSPFTAVVAVAGARAYAAFFTTGLGSSSHGYAISYYSAALVSDKLFAPPITYVPSAPTEPLTGTVTKGTHLLAYRIIYRSGFKGRPCPDSGSGTPNHTTFLPVSFTSAGLKNLSWTLNTTWPTGAVGVQVLMTPVSNRAQWYEVPGAYAALSGGGSQSVTIAFDISDEELRATGINDATDSQFLMTQTAAGAAPFTPHFVFPCGNRMGYLATFPDSAGNAVGSLIISERDRFQEVYADRSLIQCPDLPIIRTACYLGNTVYMFGIDGTFATSDTGLDPSAWPTPRPISRTIGSRCIRGVRVWPDESGAWVVDTAGLQMLTGDGYADRPISYAQSDIWHRINWSATHIVEVEDDQDRKIVSVKVALDSATSASHILTWNYSRGRRWDKADFSPWTTSGYNVGAMGLVVNDWSGSATANLKQRELCLGPAGSDYLLRQKTIHDTNPYRDAANAAISFRYKTMLLPPGNQGTVMMHFGGHIRARGSGTLTVKAYGRDDAWNLTLANTIVLAAAPGQEYFRGFSRLAEQVAMDFTMNAVDEYCHLSGYKHHHLPHSVKR